MAASAAALKKSAHTTGLRAIVFDWDGTLVETMPIKIRNAALLFSKNWGVHPEGVATSYRKYSGVPRRELFDLIAKENMGRLLSPLQFNRISHEFTRLNLETYTKEEIFTQTTLSVLKSLKKKGLLLFVSSAAIREEIEELAKSLGINTFFEEILGSEGPFKKGGPHFRHVCNKYRLSPMEILFIGDEEADMRLASHLGIRCVGIGPNADIKLTDTFADYTIKDLEELNEIIRII